FSHKSATPDLCIAHTAALASPASHHQHASLVEESNARKKAPAWRRKQGTAAVRTHQAERSALATLREARQGSGGADRDEATQTQETPQRRLAMATAKQRAAARRNIKKAAAARRRSGRSSNRTSRRRKTAAVAVIARRRRARRAEGKSGGSTREAA